jgi:ABC-type dipeptide/oligopeptide/nickel transport system permease subunit
MTGIVKLGAGIVIALIAFAVIGPLLGHGSVTAMSGTLFAGPSAAHWLGTDNLGRDTFTRLAVATGSTLLISSVSAIVAMILGTALGIIAGYGGRLADALVMRGVDIALAVPAILLALIVRVIFGPGVLPLILAMALISAPLFARVVRGPVRLVRERDFIAAAEIAGVGRMRIALGHLVPNILTPIAIQFANTASLAVLLEASLSYLGQGVQAPQPSAGRMISEFQRYLGDEPQLVLLPAALIVLITVAWNLIADGVQHPSPTTRKIPR